MTPDQEKALRAELEKARAAATVHFEEAGKLAAKNADLDKANEVLARANADLQSKEGAALTSLRTALAAAQGALREAREENAALREALRKIAAYADGQAGAFAIRADEDGDGHRIAAGRGTDAQHQRHLASIAFMGIAREARAVTGPASEKAICQSPAPGDSMTPVKLVALLLCAGCSYSAVPTGSPAAPAEAIVECRKVCPAATTAQVTSHFDGLTYRWTCGCMDPVECRR